MDGNNCKFVYVKGEDNCIADALSRYPHNALSDQKVAEENTQHPYHYSIDDEVLAVVSSYTALEHVAAMMNPDSQPKNASEITIDKDVINEMKEAYKTDKWRSSQSPTLSSGLPADYH